MFCADLSFLESIAEPIAVQESAVISEDIAAAR